MYPKIIQFQNEAICYINEQKYFQAIPGLLQAFNLNRDDLRTLELLGETSYSLGVEACAQDNYPEALGFFAQALDYFDTLQDKTRDPEQKVFAHSWQIELLMAQVEIHTRLEDFQEAAEVYADILILDPDPYNIICYAICLSNYALQLKNDTRYTASLIKFSEAINLLEQELNNCLDSNDRPQLLDNLSISLINRACLLAIMRDYPKAIVDLKHSIVLDSSCARAKELLGNAYLCLALDLFQEKAFKAGLENLELALEYTSENEYAAQTLLELADKLMTEATLVLSNGHQYLHAQLLKMYTRINMQYRYIISHN